MNLWDAKNLKASEKTSKVGNTKNVTESAEKLDWKWQLATACLSRK